MFIQLVYNKNWSILLEHAVCSEMDKSQPPHLLPLAKEVFKALQPLVEQEGPLMRHPVVAEVYREPVAHT